MKFQLLRDDLTHQMKLACVTLSWSARGLDKTSCWPIKLGDWQLYAQGLSFHHCRSVRTNQEHGLSFHSHKEEFIRLFIPERATPTFLFSLAISRFSQRDSPLVVTCQSPRTRRDDGYADVVFTDLGRGPEKTDTRPGGI